MLAVSMVVRKLCDLTMQYLHEQMVSLFKEHNGMLFKIGVMWKPLEELGIESVW
jgi:hypothetical protein